MRQVDEKINLLCDEPHKFVYIQWPPAKLQSPLNSTASLNLTLEFYLSFAMFFRFLLKTILPRRATGIAPTLRQSSIIRHKFNMKINTHLAALIITVIIAIPNPTVKAQDKNSNIEPAIKFEIVSQLLRSNVRNGIGLKDLNGDSLPDLIIGSNAHRFDSATQSINADPNAGFRTNTRVPDHYQVSIHLNETKKASVSLSENPQLRVPITANDLIVPPG